MASITAITVAHLARTLGSLGIDPARVLGDLQPHVDARFEERISVDALIELWERAVAVTGRRDLPAIASTYANPEERSLITFVVVNQPRFSDGIDRFHRYSPTVSDAYAWSIVDDAPELRVRLSPTGPIHRRGWQYHLEFEALDVVHSVIRLTAGAARPSAIQFLHPAPAPEVIDAYARITGVTPVFGSDRCTLVYPITVRSIAIATARPALATAIEAQLDAMVDAIDRGVVVSARARAAISDLLDRRSVGVDELASALAMSRRSLERALADEGTSAAALIEEERKQRALAWLPVLSVDEVAARLAYSDARAFARAFKRWTGLAPSQFRR